ncbi:P-loop containing nucleoside triphosphate hydrolase protein [Suillus plorans]|uniref:P-loop containing nucleoside triphosphate hydrolase protein n=1 Tax=Suillus plorans TaxID=116603 RepID=A0A9P7AAY8_9AGAM|nr:P-loop containing nucleoside triphosphate hydrolase protein [Suillus plorans]KAG1784820.1 P-loop containing nucleoside triphosphate hydrolase protein [Suillus plorans]
MTFISSILSWFSSIFFSKAAEISVVGLQASGKTSFVNVIGSGQWSEDVVPTIAFNYRKVRKGAVTLKIWDVAGQPKFRSMWERYCNGVDALVYVVLLSSNADGYLQQEKFDTACFELHQLLAQPNLTGVPLLVLGNKNDIPSHASVKDLIRDLQLDKIQDRPVSCYSCSMKSQHNLDIVLRWLSDRSH